MQKGWGGDLCKGAGKEYSRGYAGRQEGGDRHGEVGNECPMGWGYTGKSGRPWQSNCHRHHWNPAPTSTPLSRAAREKGRVGRIRGIRGRQANVQPPSTWAKENTSSPSHRAAPTAPSSSPSPKAKVGREAGQGTGKYINPPSVKGWGREGEGRGGQKGNTR